VEENPKMMITELRTIELSNMLLFHKSLKWKLMRNYVWNIVTLRARLDWGGREGGEVKGRGVK